jgi:hypothetical protein
MTSPHVTEKYSLGPVKSWVENAGNLLGDMFGISTEYGWRASDPFPDHPSGHAIDFMTPNMTTGDALSNYAVANYQALGIKYVIWNRQVWTPAQGWHPYTATTNPHTDHVHITFNDAPGAWTSQPGFVPPVNADLAAANMRPSSGDTCAWHIALPHTDPFCLISKTQTRALIGALFIAGGLAIGIVGGAFLLFYGLKRSGAVKLIPGPVRKLV